MILTPLDVQQKTFGTALRGYDLDEVDQFLDNVVKTLKHHEDQLKASTERQSRLETELSKHTETDEQISRALLAAQRSADQVVADARREADRIVEEARRRADEVAAKRELERSRLQLEVDNIRAGISELRTRIGGLVTSMEADLDSMERAADQTEAQFATDDFPPRSVSDETGQDTTEPVDSPGPDADGSVSSGLDPVSSSPELEGAIYDQDLDDAAVDPVLDVDEGWDSPPSEPVDPVEPPTLGDLDAGGDDLFTSFERSAADLPSAEPADEPSGDPSRDEPGHDEPGHDDPGQADAGPGALGPDSDAVPDLPVRKPTQWKGQEEDRASEWRRTDLDDIEPYGHSVD